MNETYFYNATVRKIVAVFGSIFNNIYTGKLISGKLENIARVPLSYGPRERFLVRIRTADNSKNGDVAIRLPRMSFEIVSLSYDATALLNRNNTRTFTITGDADSRTIVRQSTPYILGMQLSILADNQDSGLQVLEQILPKFRPELTVTVKDMEGPDTRTDVPITLNGVTLSDDYEGDFESGRRSIIYTLDFNIKVKFIGAVTNTAKIIKEITVNLFDNNVCDTDKVKIDQVVVGLGDPVNDTPESHTVTTTFGFD